MIDLADSCFKGAKIRNQDEISLYLVPKNNGKREKGVFIVTDKCVNLSVRKRVHVASVYFRMLKI